MAIDASFFQRRYGVALMRYDHSANEWFFVCWAVKRTWVIDLPPGNHTFALWAILGQLSGPISLRHDAWVSINAMKTRR